MTSDMIRRAVRAGTLADEITPVLLGSAFKNKGVQPLLDAVIDYLPSPLDVPPMIGIDPKTGADVERHASIEEPFSALAFKVMSDPYVGKLTYFRVYSGKLKAGDRVLNTTTGKTERVSRILQMHANHREERDEIAAGEIAAGVGLKHTTTGDTLAVESAPIVLESMTFPEPVIAVAVEPKSKVDQDKLGAGLARLAEEDPDLPRQHRRRDRPDDHLRHGRAAPRDHRRPPQARVQRRRERRPPAGRVPRDDLEAGREGPGPVRPSDGRLGPVRRRHHQRLPAGAGQGLRVHRQDRRRQDPEGVHPGRRRGHPRGDGRRRARRVPRRRRGRRADRRLVPRGRLERAGVQDRRLDGLQGGAEAGEAEAARARDGGRGDDAARSTSAT